MEKALKEKLNNYFDHKIKQYGDFADWHIRESKKATHKDTIKHHEKMAWQYSELYAAIFNDTRKDLLKLL